MSEQLSILSCDAERLANSACSAEAPPLFLLPPFLPRLCPRHTGLWCGHSVSQEKATGGKSFTLLFSRCPPLIKTEKRAMLSSKFSFKFYCHLLGQYPFLSPTIQRRVGCWPQDLGIVLQPEKFKAWRAAKVGNISSWGQGPAFLTHFKSYPRGFLGHVSSCEWREASRSL